MRLLAALLPVGALAAWPGSASFKGASPLILEGGCFDASTGAPIKCSTAPSGAVRLNVDSSGAAQPNCAWLSDVDYAPTGSKVGGLITTYGPKVAAMPGCCQAMRDITQTMWGGNFGAISVLTYCQTEECVANGTSGNLNPLYWTGPTNSSASSYVGRAPSDAQMAKNVQILFQNNAQCFDAGVAYMSANAHTVHNGNLATMFTANKAGVWAALVTPGCVYNPTYPAPSAAACSNETTYHPIVSEEQCFSDFTGSPANGPISCAGSPAIRVTAPNCMWQSTSPGQLGKLNMNYGPVAAAIPGCCHALQDTTQIAYVAGGYPMTFSKCQSHSGCLADTSAQPANYWNPASNVTTPPSSYVNIMPSFAAWIGGVDRVLVNGGQCFEAASTYYTVNSGVASNIALGPAYSGYIAAMKAAFVNTTRACGIPGVNFGLLKVACCSAVRALLADKNNVANAYSASTVSLCGEVGCASSVLASLKSVPAASWSLEHERVKTVLGASTLYAAVTPDVCAASLPAYLTTTSTTTTTTPAPVAAAVKVSSSYVAVETLPTNVTADVLMASDTYISAKRAGLAAALSVSASAIVVTGFEVTVSRRQLSTVRALSSSVSVKTSFVVTVATESAATSLSTTLASASAAIKTQTDAAMAASDWSGDSFAAPSMAAPTVAAALVAAIPVLTAGDWSVSYFTDAACSSVDGSASTLVGSIAASGCTASSGTSLRIARCGVKAEVDTFASADCTGSVTSSQKSTDVCAARLGLPGRFERVVCAPATAAVSSAASVSVAAIGAFLFSATLI